MSDDTVQCPRSGDCPAPESGTNPDNVGNKLAQEIVCLRSDISRRANLESGLRAGVVRLQDDVRRLESIIAASQRIFAPVAWAVSIGSKGIFSPKRYVSLQSESGMGSCYRPTLTDVERAAVEYFAAFHQSPREADASAAATLRALLERTK